MTASPRMCSWCRAAELLDPRAVYCSRRCRQSAWRLRCNVSLEASHDGPGRFAYADPPYPGLARRYYGRETTYSGEVDHRALIAQLVAGNYTGWALSTSERALRDVLPLCPLGARVCPWVKPQAVSKRTRGIHNAWEPLIVVGGRQRRPGRPDWLRAQPARRGGTLLGRKPLQFAAWLFGLLGMRPGDAFEDLFPGTGIIGRAWTNLSLGAPADASLTDPRDTSPRAASDAL